MLCQINFPPRFHARQHPERKQTRARATSAPFINVCLCVCICAQVHAMRARCNVCTFVFFSPFFFPAFLRHPQRENGPPRRIEKNSSGDVAGHNTSPLFPSHRNPRRAREKSPAPVREIHREQHATIVVGSRALLQTPSPPLSLSLAHFFFYSLLLFCSFNRRKCEAYKKMSPRHNRHHFTVPYRVLFLPALLLHLSRFPSVRSLFRFPLRVPSLVPYVTIPR